MESATRGTVLLVDDNPTIVEMVKLVLEMEGFEVISASDACSALDLGLSYPQSICLLLTDIMLGPGLNGREVAEQLRRVRPHMPVLYISGYSDDANVEAEISRADAVFLPKPFSVRTLAEKVNQALNSRKQSINSRA